MHRLLAGHGAAKSPRRRGRPPAARLPDEEVAEIVRRWTATQESADGGSLRVAVLDAWEAGAIQSPAARLLLDRIQTRRPIPPALRNQLRVAAPVFITARDRSLARLELTHTPGSLPWLGGDGDGPIVPGQVWTIDDGTINAYAWAQSLRPDGRPYVGRWQLLICVDQRSYYILAWGLTARPRGTYRAEDLMSVIGAGFHSHGLPRTLLLEGGISAARNISEGARRLGIRIHRASGPHQKVAEIVFDSLWSDLSSLPGHVGRDRGQYPAVDALYQRCLTGNADPREHFAHVGQLAGAIERAVARWNSHVVSSRYGQWIPADVWRGARLRQPPALWQALWAPRIAELTVRGLMLRTTTQAADGWPCTYTYIGECLAEWQGARVRLHHDPRSDAPAIVTLARPSLGRPAGHVIGRVELVDRATRWALAALGYVPSVEDDRGGRVAQAQAWLYRQVRAVTQHQTREAQAGDTRAGVRRAADEAIGPIPMSEAFRPVTLRPVTPTEHQDTDPRLEEFEP